jgi:hypothetical protein
MTKAARIQVERMEVECPQTVVQTRLNQKHTDAHVGDAGWSGMSTRRTRRSTLSELKTNVEEV